MRSITLNSQSFFLLDDAPDWAASPKTDFEQIVDTAAGLTNREARRPFAQSLRIKKHSFDILAQGAAARTLEGQLRALKDEKTLVPFWPAPTEYAVRAAAGLASMLWFVQNEDATKWAVVDDAHSSFVSSEGSLAWVASTDTTWPVLCGYLDGRDLFWETDDLASFPVEFVESSPVEWALQPAAISISSGPQPAAYGTAPKLFPWQVDFNGVEGSLTLRVEREKIGFGRETFDTFHTQSVVRTVGSSHVLHADLGVTPPQLLRFWLDHSAGKSFWFPAWKSASELTANVTAIDTVLNVTDTDAILPGDALGFFVNALPVAHGLVASKTSTTVTLSAAPANIGATFPLVAADTAVVPLYLAAFNKNVLSVTWHADGFAEVKLSVRDLPPEYAPGAGETLGTTLGGLSTRAFLYEFTRTYGATTVTNRYTSFERDLVYGGNTYTATKLTHGSINQGIALDRDELTLTVDGLNCPPVFDMATLRSEVPVFLLLTSVDVSSAFVTSNAAALFKGELTKASLNGKKLTATSVSYGTLMERKIPRHMLQIGCNYNLFSVGCGLLLADWKFTGTLSNVGAAGYPFDFEVSSIARVTGPTPTYFADWFAGGWMEFGTGANLVRRSILKNTAPSGGVSVFTLHDDPNPFPYLSDPVVIYPGCDGRVETCKAYHATNNPAGKFNNFLNFGGHPFVPPGNPSLLKISSDLGGGGKK